MEIRTAGEIYEAVCRGDGPNSTNLVTDATSEWVRRASVDAELEKVKEMLREASDVIDSMDQHALRIGVILLPRNNYIRARINKYLTEVPRG